MALQVIRGGAPVDIPTPAEVADAVDERARAFAREQRQIEEARELERYRGIKPIRYAAAGPGTGGAKAYLIEHGPELGYVWQLKLFSLTLNTAGTVQLYLASAAPSTGAVPRLMIASQEVTATNLVFTWSGNQVLVMPGESLYVSSNQFSLSYFMSAMQVPAEQVAKFIG
jgi:hypothetical protein